MQQNSNDEFTGTPAEVARPLLTQQGMRALNAILVGDFIRTSDRAFDVQRGLIKLSVEAGKKIDFVSTLHSIEIPTPAVEATYVLTPEGEQIIRDLIETTPMTPADVTVAGDALEKQFDAGPSRFLRHVSGRDHAVGAKALAVRDLIEANSLIAGAVATLGHEAADLIMQNLLTPGAGAVAAWGHPDSGAGVDTCPGRPPHRDLMPPYISRRIPPAVVGACRVLHAVLPLPEAGPLPGEDVTLAEVLAGQARVLALSVEAAAPGAMDRLVSGEPCGD